jgi:hypothetical protein
MPRPRRRRPEKLVRTSFSIERPLYAAFERLARQG